MSTAFSESTGLQGTQWLFCHRFVTLPDFKSKTRWCSFAVFQNIVWLLILQILFRRRQQHSLKSRLETLRGRTPEWMVFTRNGKEGLSAILLLRLAPRCDGACRRSCEKTILRWDLHHLRGGGSKYLQRIVQKPRTESTEFSRTALISAF